MPDNEKDGIFCVAETTSGKIQGLLNAGVRQFKGVPYGAPTSGTNRFMPPKKPAAWAGVRECISYGPTSPQIPTDANNPYGQLIHFDLIGGAGGLGEDCLCLNIWTPALRDGGKRPVLFSIHGGGFAIGSGNCELYDGTQLAMRDDVVVVTVTHRLASFGHLNLVDVGAPEEFSMAGCAGIMDIVLALEWVRENIANFGGDPDCVMIFGQSGGGWKTSILLATDAANGLFHRAAVQSGSVLRLQTREEAAAASAALIASLGFSKNNIADIQKVSWQKLLAAQAATGANLFSPVLDGHYWTHHPFDPAAPDQSADIPLMISTTLDDAGLFFGNYDLSENDLEAFLRASYSDADGELLKLYKRGWPQKTPFLRQAQIITDAGFRRFAYEQAQRKSLQGRAPVYMYQWDWPGPGFDGIYGAVHGIDVAASFRNVRDPILGAGCRTGRNLSDQLAASWVAFAKTGSPHNDLVGNWPAYNSVDRATMIFDDPSHMTNDPNREIREFWSRMPAASTVFG
jgi:para-nitrobenzyl esterase